MAQQNPCGQGSVLVLGASEVKRLGNALHALPAPLPPLKPNFGLKEATVHVYGVSGREARDVKDRDMWIIQQIKPQVVILAVGGNDLSRTDFHGQPEVVGLNLTQLAEYMHLQLGVSHVLVSSLGRRYPPYCGRVYPINYDHKVMISNQYLEVVLGDLEFVTFWDNTVNMLNWPAHFYSLDGVHLNEIGTKYWYKSLRGGMIAALSGRL